MMSKHTVSVYDMILGLESGEEYPLRAPGGYPDGIPSPPFCMPF